MNLSPVGPIARRLAALDWTAMGDSLDRLGYATTGPLLSAEVTRAFGWRVVFLGLIPLVALAGALALPPLVRIGRPPAEGGAVREPAVEQQPSPARPAATEGSPSVGRSGVGVGRCLRIVAVTCGVDRDHGSLRAMDSML